MESILSHPLLINTQNLIQSKSNKDCKECLANLLKIRKTENIPCHEEEKNIFTELNVHMNMLTSINLQEKNLS